MGSRHTPTSRAAGRLCPATTPPFVASPNLHPPDPTALEGGGGEANLGKMGPGAHARTRVCLPLPSTCAPQAFVRALLSPGTWPQISRLGEMLHLGADSVSRGCLGPGSDMEGALVIETGTKASVPMSSWRRLTPGHRGLVLDTARDAKAWPSRMYQAVTLGALVRWGAHMHCGES